MKTKTATVYLRFVTDKCGEVSNSLVSSLWTVGFLLPVENEHLKVTSLIVFALPFADVVIGNPKHQHYFLFFGVFLPRTSRGV